MFDYGETDELAYIVMEFVEGRSLKEVLEADQRLPLAETLGLMDDILAGLSYSHARGVVHRDIKPANIMLTQDGQAKIADFGIARIESQQHDAGGHGAWARRPTCRPSSSWARVVDRRTDIYSCGVMLYQLLTGERPFEGSMTSIMHKAMTTTPPRPSELAVTSPRLLDGVVAKAMARRPDDRFDSAAAFAAALRAPPALDDQDSDETVVAPRTAARPVPAAAPLAAVPVLPAAKRSRIPVLAGTGVAVVVVAGVAAWVLMPNRDAPAAAPRMASLSRPATDSAAPSTAQPDRSGGAVAPQPAPAPLAAVPPAPPPTVAAPGAVAQTPVVQTPAALAPSAQVLSTPAPAALPTPAPTPEPVQPPPTATASPFVVPAAPVPPLPAPTTPPASSPQQMASAESPPAATPTRTPAAVASALATSLPGVACTLPSATSGPGGTVTITGLAGVGAPAAALRQAVEAAGPAGTDWRVASFDGPYCPVLDLLRGVPGAASAGLSLAQDGGPAPLEDNQTIALHATMPGFSGYLHMAYIQHNESVSPLVPGPDYPVQTYPARTSIALGQPHKGSPGWVVGPPFGTDMVVAVASTAPLFAKALPDDQTLTAYLSGLQSAMEAVRRRGGTVAVAAVVLDTRPAPLPASQPGTPPRR